MKKPFQVRHFSVLVCPKSSKPKAFPSDLQNTQGQTSG